MPQTRLVALSALAAVIMLFVTFFNAVSGIAAEIKLLATNNSAMRSALRELVPDFERSAGHKVSMDFASANPLKKRIDAGETFDLLIAPVLVDELIRQAKVVADTRAMVVRTGLVVRHAQRNSQA